MPTVSTPYRVFIQAPPAAVFNYVADITRHAEWSGGNLKIEAASAGPLAVGSVYRSYGDVAVQKDRFNELRVTQLETPARFAFVAKDPDFGDVTHDFTFAPQAGGTLMVRTVSMEMSPLQSFIFRAVIRRFIGTPMMNKAFAALKTKLEQRAV